MQTNEPHNTTAVINALITHKGDFVANEEALHKILFHIPEKKVHVVEASPRLRSPYLWAGVANMVTICVLFVTVYLPQTPSVVLGDDYELYQTDSQIDAYEANINQEDYNALITEQV